MWGLKHLENLHQNACLDSSRVGFESDDRANAWLYSSVILEAGHELGITPTNTGDGQLLKDGFYAHGLIGSDCLSFPTAVIKHHDQKLLREERAS